MRNKLAVLVALLFAITLASAAPAAAQPNKPDTCDIDFTFNPTLFIYEGTATNCEYAGVVEGYVFDAIFPGNTEHWVGATVLYPDAGGVIVIADKGVWNIVDPNLDNADKRCDLQPDPAPPFDTCLKYRTNGEVVEELEIRGQLVSTTYGELIGAKAHGMGYTSYFDEGAFVGAYEFIAQQTLRIH